MREGDRQAHPGLIPRRDREELPRFLELLARGREEEIWPAFVHSYSAVIMQVVRLFARNEDEASDCLLFCYGRLNRRGCRRLRRFDPSGPAKFTTWLHAVVYNLCRDWRRARSPRRHAFRVISGLPAFEQEVFRLYFERRMSGTRPRGRGSSSFGLEERARRSRGNGALRLAAAATSERVEHAHAQLDLPVGVDVGDRATEVRLRLALPRRFRWPERPRR